MFVLSATLRPANGKARELSTAMLDWVKHGQASGQRMALSRDFWGTEGPALRISHMYESLDEANSWRNKVQNDPKAAGLMSKFGELLAGPVSWRLADVINAKPGPTGTGSVALLATMRPKPGKAAAVRKLLNDWVEYRRNQGATIALAEDIWSPYGQSFHVRHVFKSVAEADEARKQVQEDPEYQKTIAELIPMLDEPVTWGLRDILIPMNG